MCLMFFSGTHNIISFLSIFLAFLNGHLSFAMCHYLHFEKADGDPEKVISGCWSVMGVGGTGVVCKRVCVCFKDT